MCGPNPANLSGKRQYTVIQQHCSCTDCQRAAISHCQCIQVKQQVHTRCIFDSESVLNIASADGTRHSARTVTTIILKDTMTFKIVDNHRNSSNKAITDIAVNQVKHEGMSLSLPFNFYIRKLCFASHLKLVHRKRSQVPTAARFFGSRV